MHACASGVMGFPAQNPSVRVAAWRFVPGAAGRHARTSTRQSRGGEPMYIGIGTLIVIIILILIFA